MKRLKGLTPEEMGSKQRINKVTYSKTLLLKRNYQNQTFQVNSKSPLKHQLKLWQVEGQLEIIIESIIMKPFSRLLPALERNYPVEMIIVMYKLKVI